ncbi:hypothetical protein LLE49_25170 [Alicyclobacillus tolerans]|uniref:DUF6744 family protein n=1 Tax=Alicyclobacillus tolerans TaxID=90970 RepID=UPI001F1B37D1|nr:DUF6744 family protein [Alicyclobacillus tolerans]MCF8568020.1 hypothetical protein [Alicyclobacillus tolerans]
MALKQVELENLVATQSEKATRIGWLFWFVIAESHTDQVVVADAFHASGLPSAYALPEIRPVDAYKRATKSIEGRVQLPNENNIELLVRKVRSPKHEVIRHLVVEENHVQNRQLSYDANAAILRFDHELRTIDYSVHSAEPFVKDAVNTFAANYQLYLNTYDGPAKRRTARAVLLDLSATALKETGGVYLVPRENEELLFQLYAFINALPGCKAYKMPVEDTAEARDMVRDVVTNKAEILLTEIRSKLKADLVSEQDVQALLEKARRMRKEVTTYQNILRESIGTLETDVDLLEAQMMNLIEQL